MSAGAGRITPTDHDDDPLAAGQLSYVRKLQRRANAAPDCCRFSLMSKLAVPTWHQRVSKQDNPVTMIARLIRHWIPTASRQSIHRFSGDQLTFDKYPAKIGKQPT